MKSTPTRFFLLLLALLAFGTTGFAQAPRKLPVFVLVPATWQGGWYWQRVSTRLRAAGATVYTPSLSGLAEHRHTLNAAINLDTHITEIVNLLELEDLHDVVLVGHSYGGAVVAGVADRAPGRLRQLVFLDALLLENGQSVLSIQSPETQAYFATATAPDQGLTLPTSTSQGFGVKNPADVAWVDARLTPQPYRTFTQPLVLHHAFGNELPLTYIACTKTELPVVAKFGAATKANKRWRYYELPTGHEPMITMPQELTALLLAIGKR